VRALVYAEQSVTLRDIPDPTTSGDETLVRVLRTGLCGTDHGIVRRGRPAAAEGVTMGHEIVGIRVTDGSRVVVDPMVPCTACAACDAGMTNLCTDLKIIGVHLNGGFADLVSVPTTHLIEVPTNCSDEQAALAEPVATAVHAWGRAGLAEGARVAVIGAGAIGLCVIAVAKASGAATIDVSDIDETKLGYARALGASADVVSGHYDAVFECVGLVQTRQLALSLVRPGGDLVMVGLADSEAVYEGRQIVTFERNIRGSFGYSHADFAHAIPIVAGMAVDWVQTFPAEAGPGLLDGTTSASPSAAKVQLDFTVAPTSLITASKLGSK
jgi:threonine dehydrogenase-like Zn-dependent dehydrogenase